MERPLCFHCQQNLAQKCRGGLCDSCYRDHEIRNYYRSNGTIVRRPATKRRSYSTKEPSMEELELQIQERMATMPEREFDLDDPDNAPRPAQIYTIQCDRRWNGRLYH